MRPGLLCGRTACARVHAAGRQCRVLRRRLRALFGRRPGPLPPFLRVVASAHRHNSRSPTTPVPPSRCQSVLGPQPTPSSSTPVPPSPRRCSHPRVHKHKHTARACIHARVCIHTNVHTHTPPTHTRTCADTQRWQRYRRGGPWSNMCSLIVGWWPGGVLGAPDHHIHFRSTKSLANTVV